MQKLLALGLLLLPMTAMANHPPPPFPDGMAIVFTADCTDVESGEKGFCIYFEDATGQEWLGFYRNEVIAMVRKIAPDGSYITTWRADVFDSI